jgi:hypothetical protein
MANEMHTLKIGNKNYPICSQKIYLYSDNTNGAYPLVFAKAIAAGDVQSLYTDSVSDISYNPSTNMFSVSNETIVTSSIGTATVGTLNTDNLVTSLTEFNFKDPDGYVIMKINADGLTVSNATIGGVAIPGSINDLSNNITVLDGKFNKLLPYATIGTSTKPVYINNGVIVECDAYPTKASLGLSNALTYIGITTTALTDGSTTKTIAIKNGGNHTASNGNVVFYGDKEFIFNGSSWEEFGYPTTVDLSGYKPIQSAVSDVSTTNVTTTEFVSSVTQNANGVISVTKKKLPTYSNNAGTVTEVKTGKGLTGGPITSSGTIKCNLNSEASLGTIGNTDKLYAVGVDSNGKLCVNVPWSAGSSTTGTVTEVKTGTGLTGGPITSSGTISISKYSPTSTNVSDGVAYIDDGVMEVGHIIDFHSKAGDDYNIRLRTKAGETGTYTVTLPSATGTLALTSDITDTNYYPSRSYTSGLQISTSKGVADTCALFVPNASGTTQAGVVSTGAQTFGGNKIFKGTVTSESGLFDTSDERLKTFLNDIEIDFEKLANISKKYFTWKDGDGSLQIGTSAQEVQKIYPELVTEDDNGVLSVAYNKLSIIGLAAIDKLYEELSDEKRKRLELETRLAKLEQLLNK